MKLSELSKDIKRAGCVVIGDDNILMIYKKNKWQLPKGKIKTGESAADAAKRETLEETGIYCDISSDFATILRNKYAEVYYLAFYISGNICGGDKKEKITQCAWIPFNQAIHRIIDRQKPILKQFSSRIKNKL